MKKLFLSFFLAIAGMLLWQYEIYSIHSGEGLYWLNRNLLSPYLITLLVVLSFLLPFILKRKINVKKALVMVAILYGVSIFCFVSGKELNYLMYCRFCGWTTIHLLIFLLLGIGIFIIMGFGLWLTVCRFSEPIKKSAIIFTVGILLAVIPLSMLTTEFFPLYNQTDWVDTVKSGFPVFWITLLMGIAGVRMEHQQKNH